MSIKKMVALLVLLLLIYIGFSFFSKTKDLSHEVSYEIQNEGKTFKVKEILTYHEKKEKDNYYFEIDVQGQLFTIQLFETSDKKKYMLNDIHYYEEGEYVCILPTFKSTNLSVEILCRKDEITYPYHTIKGESKNVDAFAESLNYDDTPYLEDLSDVLKKGTLSIYRKNLLENHFLALENYKGIALINSKDIYKNIELFTSDKYTKNMSIFAENFYVSADYNQKYNFNEFFLVNIKTGKKETIINHNALNLDGYAMGFIDNKIYFFDKGTHEQYNIDLKKKKINKVGNKETGIQVYVNNVWETKNSSEAYQNKLTFYEEKRVGEFNVFERVDKVGSEKSGYYYFYKKQNGKYQVYRSPILNPKNYTYLFDTTNIDNIVYQNDFIYFIHENRIQYYNDKTGVKTVLSNTEFKYNKSLKIGLFIS